jgi:hypothetical protein
MILSLPIWLNVISGVAAVAAAIFWVQSARQEIPKFSFTWDSLGPEMEIALNDAFAAASSFSKKAAICACVAATSQAIVAFLAAAGASI